jgi:hypothetical protein
MGHTFYPHWTEDEIACLTENLGELNFDELAEALNRTTKSIKRKVSDLRLLNNRAIERATARIKNEPGLVHIRRPTTIEWAQGRSVEMRFAVFLRLTAHTPSDEYTREVWDQLFPCIEAVFTDDTTDDETRAVLHDIFDGGGRE